MMTSSCLKLNLLYLLLKIPASSLHCFCAVYVLHAGLFHKRAFFYAPRPLIDRGPWNDVTSLTTYTTNTRTSDTNI